MFCEKCGAKLEANAAFCEKCGEEVTIDPPAVGEPAIRMESTPVQEETPVVVIETIPPKGKKWIPWKKYLTIAGGIAFVLLFIVLYFRYRDTYESPIKNFYTGIEKHDFETYLKAFPDPVQERMQSWTDARKKSAVNRYDEGTTISFRIVRKEALSESALNTYRNLMIAEGLGTHVVDAGYNLKLEITLTGTLTEKTDTVSVTVCRVDRRWVILEN